MRKIVLILTLLLMVIPAVAQTEQLADGVITADEVNAIARDLYCPVCENIPLDACGTAACDDWRYEIQLQLEDGKSTQEIIDDFVVRFGDRVVGTPQDPALRAMSLVTPWIVIGLAFAGLIYSVFRWQRNQSSDGERVDTSAPEPETDLYRNILERDLAG